MKKLTRFALAAIVGLGAFPTADLAHAQAASRKIAPSPSGMVPVPPQSVGMSPERVDRISKTMQHYVTDGHRRHLLRGRSGQGAVEGRGD